MTDCFTDRLEIDAIKSDGEYLYTYPQKNLTSDQLTKPDIRIDGPHGRHKTAKVISSPK